LMIRIFDDIQSKANKLIMVTAFGELSRLELACLLGDKMVGMNQVCGNLALVDLRIRDSRTITRLAGLFKVGTPLGRIVADEGKFRFDMSPTDLLDEKSKINFCLSLYCIDKPTTAQIYEKLTSSLLSDIRRLGFKKANLIRPGRDTEITSSDILRRKLIDFLSYPTEDGYVIGITEYVPDFAGIHERSTLRPVPASDIALSPMLAHVLINISGVQKGGCLLDPFCGSGTILVEAMLEGFRCIGVDIDRTRIEEASKNLHWLERKFKLPQEASFELKIGDSRRLSSILDHIRVDAVVTEPILLPKFASLPSKDTVDSAIRRAEAIYKASLVAISKVVRKGGRVVLVVPSVRTKENTSEEVELKGIQEAGLREYQPPSSQRFHYPVDVGGQSTRWLKRKVYVFERE
jgi:tRNA G10  N-methylase Trm11